MGIVFAIFAGFFFYLPLFTGLSFSLLILSIYGSPVKLVLLNYLMSLFVMFFIDVPLPLFFLPLVELIFPELLLLDGFCTDSYSFGYSYELSHPNVLLMEGASNSGAGVGCTPDDLPPSYESVVASSRSSRSVTCTVNCNYNPISSVPTITTEFSSGVSSERLASVPYSSSSALKYPVRITLANIEFKDLGSVKISGYTPNVLQLVDGIQHWVKALSVPEANPKGLLPIQEAISEFLELHPETKVVCAKGSKFIKVPHCIVGRLSI